MAEDYGIGATLGIVGAGVSLYALRGLIDTVQGGVRPRKQTYKKSKNLRSVQKGRGFTFNPPVRFHL